MEPSLVLHVVPEILESSQVFDVGLASVGPGHFRVGARGEVFREDLADVEIHRPHDAFIELVARAATDARAHVVEGGHLIESPA